ncbi:MAG: TorF family putative porin [Pseudomonadota bacterium]|nr:TorF family putative porin [Pseudomonadota bacterium]
MKKTFKLKNLALSLAVAGAASVAMVPAASQAGVSANVGVFTDYVFRGFNQASDTGSPALQGGFDYEHDSGLFAGVWGSTMDYGYEYDLYAGWGGSFEGVDLGAAYTAYYYTDEDVYGDGAAFEEISLSAGYGPVSLAADFDVDSDNTNYIHYAISLDASSIAEGVSLTYGVTQTEDEKDGTEYKDAGYLDIGYSTTLDMGVDLGVNFVMADAGADDTSYLVVGLSKSFDLM